MDNLEIAPVTKDILLIHQLDPPFRFSCCDGLLVLAKKGRNSETIALDINIEPNLIEFLDDEYGPITNYICTHGHMDHIAHVYKWESLGANIFAPSPESSYLLDLRNFYKGFKFDECIDYAHIEEFGEKNGYKSCDNVNSFTPGETLKFEHIILRTIPLTGHSPSHIGLYLELDKIFHISCLGFDKPSPEINGFGPWYGFRDCSIDQYLKDIDLAENFFLENGRLLTSSHSYVARHPDSHPFEYLREKIQANQQSVLLYSGKKYLKRPFPRKEDISIVETRILLSHFVNDKYLIEFELSCVEHLTELETWAN